MEEAEGLKKVRGAEGRKEVRGGRRKEEGCAQQGPRVPRELKKSFHPLLSSIY